MERSEPLKNAQGVFFKKTNIRSKTSDVRVAIELALDNSILPNHKIMSRPTIVYIDGGSRGNPGPSAFACVFPELSKEYSEYIGAVTNNVAEYSGLIFALKKAKALFGKDKAKRMELEIRSDSELLVKQMKGEYKIKEEGIQKLFLQAWNLKIDFAKVNFVAVPREQNKQADRLLNETLDNQGRKKTLF